jgi:hypothetical protein
MPKGNAKPLVEPHHPTIAVSDAFMGACCVYSALMAPLPRVSALGFGSVGAACFAGVLRFGLAPEVFRPLNEKLAAFAGRVGIPLIGLGFVGASASSAARAALPLSDVEALFALAVLCAASQCWPAPAQELYTTVVSGAGLTGVAHWGHHAGNDPLALGGVALFLLGGLAIGPERDIYTLGVRNENLFHYVCGGALLMMATAFAAAASN